jgi:hypothetical protein
VNSGIRHQLEVLDVAVDLAGLVDSKDVSVAGVVVEWVAVDVVGWFVSGKNKDGSRVGISGGGES